MTDSFQEESKTEFQEEQDISTKDKGIIYTKNIKNTFNSIV